MLICGSRPNNLFSPIVPVSKNPARYIGVPLSDNIFETRHRGNSRYTFDSPSRSRMPYTNVSDDYNNCVLDFGSHLPFVPAFGTYCQEKADEVTNKSRYCIYEDNPAIVEIHHICLRGGLLLADGTERETERKPHVRNTLVTSFPFS